MKKFYILIKIIVKIIVKNNINFEVINIELIDELIEMAKNNVTFNYTSLINTFEENYELVEVKLLQSKPVCQYVVSVKSNNFRNIFYDIFLKQCKDTDTDVFITYIYANGNYLIYNKKQKG